MLISDYLSSDIIKFIYFDLSYFREEGQKYRNILVRFLVQIKTSKSHSEINWPLKDEDEEMKRRVASLDTEEAKWNSIRRPELFFVECKPLEDFLAFSSALNKSS